MTNRELRIGNVVNYITLAQRKECVVDLELFNELEPNNGSGSNRMYHGVPITEYQLLKFGFDKKKQPGRLYDYYYIKDGFYFSFIDFHRIVYQNKALEGVKCVYVHQLQNLFFALKEKELTRVDG